MYTAFKASRNYYKQQFDDSSVSTSSCEDDDQELKIDIAAGEHEGQDLMMKSASGIRYRQLNLKESVYDVAFI